MKRAKAQGGWKYRPIRGVESLECECLKRSLENYDFSFRMCVALCTILQFTVALTGNLFVNLSEIGGIHFSSKFICR